MKYIKVRLEKTVCADVVIYVEDDTDMQKLEDISSANLSDKILPNEWKSRWGMKATILNEVGYAEAVKHRIFNAKYDIKGIV